METTPSIATGGSLPVPSPNDRPEVMGRKSTRAPEPPTGPGPRPNGPESSTSYRVEAHALRQRHASAEDAAKPSLGGRQQQGAADPGNESIDTLAKPDLRISYSEEDAQFVVKLLDPKTGEEIRQIPPQELLDMRRKLGEIRGLLFDRKS